MAYGHGKFMGNPIPSARKKASPGRHKRRRVKAKGSPKRAVHHDMTEKFKADKSTTAAVLFRQQRAWWWLQGKSAPPMDADGRPLE